MTTWTTFETIDETRTEQGEAFCVDRLGMFQRLEDDRTRFVFTKGCGRAWTCLDLQAEDGQSRECYASMRDCVQWMSARVLYGA